MGALRKKHENGCNQSRQRSGRPKVASKQEGQLTCIQSKRNRTSTAPEIREQVNYMRETSVSVLTVQRRLRNYGLKGCFSTEKPLLCKQNRVKRLNWAKKHKDWTIEQWYSLVHG